VSYVPVDQRRPCAEPGCTRYAKKPKRYCATCARARIKASKAKSHGKRVEATYGITQEEYQKLWDNAPYGPGTCYICGGKSTKMLAVDHSHKTGEVRGILCQPCNTWLLARIGKDDPDRLEFIMKNAIEYLRNPPAGKVLKKKHT
jgi:hypothetical protein